MVYLGLDAGTTSVCGVAIDGETEVSLQTFSKEHNAALPGRTAEEDIQDPERIWAVTKDIIAALVRTVSGKRGGTGHIGGLCVTGQVHGILYTDSGGRAVSPFYTWQDRRGRLYVPGEDRDWVSWIREKSGRIVPAGYGMLTHLVNKAEGKVPAAAVSLSTILDYLGMRLAGNTRPFIDPTNAHSLGLYDLQRRSFAKEALKEAGIDSRLLPEIVPVGTLIGTSADGIPIYTAVGDNQAGFAGAVADRESAILLNIGTSAQISVYTGAGKWAGEKGTIPPWVNGLEVRPYLHDDFIFTGASLAGGSAYRLLEQLFRDVCMTFCGSDPGNLLQKMNELDLPEIDEADRLRVLTHFYGTREDWTASGIIENIGKSNLKPGYLIDGFLRGIVEELYQFYGWLPAEIRGRLNLIEGVGNSLRRNSQLKNIIRERFQLPVRISKTGEEAAYGAARIARGTF